MKHFLSVLFFVTAWMLAGKVSLAQSDFSKAPVSELSERQIRFRAMEQRALELSQRLSKMSGTEPIQLIDRNESMEPVALESPAQESYDSLPGPIVEPLVLPEAENTEEEPTVFSSEVSRVAPTNQQRKGDYYFMPLIGIVASSSVSASYKDASRGIRPDDSLEGGWGNSVGFNAGKRWDNWYSDIALSYQYQKYSHPNFFHAWCHHYSSRYWDRGVLCPFFGRRILSATNRKAVSFRGYGSGVCLAAQFVRWRVILMGSNIRSLDS